MSLITAIPPAPGMGHPDAAGNPYIKMITALGRQEREEGDYVGEDGLIYCGRCRTPRQFKVTDDNLLRGYILPIPCRCREAARSARDREQFARDVEALRRRCFSSPAMADWTFARDDGSNPKLSIAQRYVRKWPEISAKNYGLYLWGPVGTGKSYFAGCIANALLEQGIPVRMSSFPELLAELSASLEGRAEAIRSLCGFPLLILDDFGTERDSAYARELIFAVVDARARAGKPLIVTSNLPPEVLRKPADTMQARIYDRILQMCLPVELAGASRRAQGREARLDDLRRMMG